MEAVDCYRTRLSDFWCRLLVPAAHRPRQASLNCRLVVLPCTCGRTGVLELDVSTLFPNARATASLLRLKVLGFDDPHRGYSLENNLEAFLQRTSSILSHLLPLFVPTVRGRPASVVDRAVMDHGNDSHPTTVSLRKSTSIRSVGFLVSTGEDFFRVV